MVFQELLVMLVTPTFLSTFLLVTILAAELLTCKSVIQQFKFEVPRCNPAGCKKVAGGRSEAKTTGRLDKWTSTPEGC